MLSVIVYTVRLPYIWTSHLATKKQTNTVLYLNFLNRDGAINLHVKDIFKHWLGNFQRKNMICWHYEHILYKLYITISRVSKYCNLQRNIRNCMMLSAISNFLPTDTADYGLYNLITTIIYLFNKIG